MSKWCYNCIGGNVFVEKGDGFAKILNPVEKKKLLVGKTQEELDRKILSFLKEWAGDLCYANHVDCVPIGQLLQDGKTGIQDLNSFKLNIEKALRSRVIQKDIAKRPAGAFDVVEYRNDTTYAYSNFVYSSTGDWLSETVDGLKRIFKNQGYFKTWKIERHRHPEYFGEDGFPVFTRIAPEPIWNITYCE